MDLSAYTQKIAEKLHPLAKAWLKEENPLSTTERCCISITKNQFSIINVNLQQDINEVTLLNTFAFDDYKSLALVLRGIVSSNQLDKTPVYWLLGPEDYQLNLIDSMPVPANEMQTALQWRLRSLISYPIEEAVLEYFELPAKKSAQNTPLIAAVTAQKALLQPVLTLLKECDLHVTTIDIPELAMLKLAALYENDEKCTAFLYFYEKMVVLNISSQKVLYFSRRITISRTTESNIDYEKLSLEVMRYFDFFRSQWRLPSPTRIFAAAEQGDPELIAKALAERLLNTVLPYTLNSTNINDKQKKEITTQFLLDYGCLLRKGLK